MKYRILQTAPDVFIPQAKAWYNLKWRHFVGHNNFLRYVGYQQWRDSAYKITFNDYNKALDFLKERIKITESQEFKPVTYPVYPPSIYPN